MATNRTRMRNSLSVKLEGLRTEVQAALRPTAHAGSIVFYEEMRVRAPVASGTLRDSIYRAHVANKSSPERQVYQVGPNIKKAKHWAWAEFGHWVYNAQGADGRFLPSKSDKSKRVRKPPGNFTAVHDLPGALAEPYFAPAVPYIRPTFDARGTAAVSAMKVRFAEVLKERGVVK